MLENIKELFHSTRSPEVTFKEEYDTYNHLQRATLSTFDLVLYLTLAITELIMKFFIKRSRN